MSANSGYSGQNQTPSPAGWWGGPQMRYGGPIGTASNYESAQQNMPGATTPNLLGATAMYGTPWQGPGVGSYGRWNWANQMQPPGQPGTPGGYQPAPPPGQPGSTPLPGSAPPPPGTPPPMTGDMSIFKDKSKINPAYTGPGGIFNTSRAEQMATPRNPGVPTEGDIWSNPAFANMAYALGSGGGGGLFGSNTPFDISQRNTGGVRTR